MTDEVMQAGTALAIVLPAATELEAMLKTENGLDATLAALKAAAMRKVSGADVSTAKGRDLMKSAAYDISKSKVEIEKRGKELTEQARREVAAVNAGIKSAAVYLDAVRDEIKRPAVEWEAAEAERKAKITADLDALRDHGMTADDGSLALAEKIRHLTTFEIGVDQFGDQAEHAEMVRENSVRQLRNLLAAAEKAEADSRELAELRAERERRDAEDAARLAKEAAEREQREAEARAEAERKAAEDRAKAEAEEAARAKIEAEKAAAAALADRAASARQYIAQLGADADKPFPVLIHLLEVELVARVDALGDHAEAIHQLRLVTLENVKARAQIAEQARKDAEAQAAREAAERAAEEAAQRERDRIAAEQKAADDERARRVADAAHRQRVRDDIATSMNGFVGELEAGLIADAIMDGAVPHVQAVL